MRFGLPAVCSAIATACFGFFPAATSLRMFEEITAWLFPGFRGMLFPFHDAHVSETLGLQARGLLAHRVVDAPHVRGRHRMCPAGLRL